MSTAAVGTKGRDTVKDEVAIRIQGLTKRYGEKTAVQELDLEVARGEFFCFLGPNGAGKTTTIKVLTGLLRPTEGRVEIGGHDVETEAIAAKRLLGYIPDHPYLYEKLTGRELMEFVAGLYQIDGEDLGDRIWGLLEAFEIGGVADQLVQDYSHGMRQKLSFASTYLHDP